MIFQNSGWQGGGYDLHVCAVPEGGRISGTSGISKTHMRKVSHRRPVLWESPGGSVARWFWWIFQDKQWRLLPSAPEVVDTCSGPVAASSAAVASRPPGVPVYRPTLVGRPPLPMGVVAAEQVAAAAAPLQPCTTLVLRNLPPHLDTWLLSQMVGDEFEADFAVVVRDPQTGGASCGFAFVNFCDGASAAQCLHDWHGREYLAGQRCQGKLHIAWAVFQGFEACFFKHYSTHKNLHDRRLLAWVAPARRHYEASFLFERRRARAALKDSGEMRKTRPQGHLPRLISDGFWQVCRRSGIRGIFLYVLFLYVFVGALSESKPAQKRFPEAPGWGLGKAPAGAPLHQSGRPTMPSTRPPRGLGGWRTGDGVSKTAAS
jgi:hypothetical protein